LTLTASPDEEAAQRRDRLAGAGLAVLSASAFGTLAIFARYAYQAGGDVPAVLFARFALAAGVMALIMAVRREPWPRGRTLGWLILLGGVGYVGQSLAFFSALRYASASLVSLLLYLYPALVTVLSVTLLGERLTRTRVLALVVALTGSVLTVGGAEGGQPLGVALGVLAALLYSAYIVAGSRLLADVGPLPSTSVILASAAAVYGVLALVQRPVFPTGALGVGAILGLALIATVVAVLTFFASVARVGPSMTSTISTLEPVVTVILAALLLGERVTPVQLLGAALVLSVVPLLTRSR